MVRAGREHIKRLLLMPMLVGGCVAGSLDLAIAFIGAGWGVPRAIAAGLRYSRRTRHLEFWEYFCTTS
jgi:hypothetical protein